MKVFIVLILSALAYAQPTISGNVTDDVTPYGFRGTWTTSAAADANHIKWGTSAGSYPNDSVVDTQELKTHHEWFVSGLTPATVIYFKTCSSVAGVEGCSGEQTMTTAAAEPGNVTLPIAPAAVSVTEPTTFSGTYTVSAGCTDLQSKLDTAAAQDGNNSYKVVVPASMICEGQFNLPAKSGANPNGTGGLLLTTDAVLPPSGSRLEESMITNLPRIRSKIMNVEYIQSGTPSNCLSNDEEGEGWLKSGSTDPNAFLYWSTWCTGNVWTAQAMSSGATLPANCTVGEWRYNTSEPTENLRVNVCHKTDEWAALDIRYRITTVNQFASLYAAANAHHWWVSGIRFETFTRPSNYTNLMSRNYGFGDQNPSNHKCHIYTVATNSSIVFDRIYLDGGGYPNRMRDTICFWVGTNMVIKGSILNELNYWRPLLSLETTPNAIFIAGALDTALIENNYFKNCHGICIFNSSDVYLEQAKNLTIRRNYFYDDPVHNAAGAVAGTYGYFRRHLIEGKRGLRWLIEGNTFRGGWKSGNQGAIIAITPRAETADPDAIIGTTDWDIRSNSFLYSPFGILGSGHTNFGGFQTIATRRIAVRNNVFYRLGTHEDGTVNGWPSYSSSDGNAMRLGVGMHNIYVANNSIIGGISDSSDAEAFSITNLPGDYKDSRLLLVSNVFTALQLKEAGVWGFRRYEFGTQGLTDGYQASWIAQGNAMQKYGFYVGGPEDTTAYPAGNYRATWTAFPAAVYRCIPCGDPAPIRPVPGGILSSGNATARGYDRRDNGVDFDVFDQAQGSTFNLHTFGIGTTTATVTYRAPDKDVACTVEYWISGTLPPYTRVLDTPGTPGNRVRSVALSGLTSGTQYFVRTYCVQMVSASFTTL